MYDPIFSKSFSRAEHKRFGWCAIFLCFIIALGISSNSKPCLLPRSLIGDDVKMQLSINAAENMFMVNGGSRGNFKPIATKIRERHAICINSNYCDIEGDIRIEANSSTIFVVSNSTKSWSIEPYPRKGTSSVKNWRVTLLNQQHNIPQCTQNHSLHPGILFSLGGFTGNFFHDFADVLFPLYSTVSPFQRRVHFLATDHKPWWIAKYREILNKLTKHNIIYVDVETPPIHCYNKLQIGLIFHKELILNPSISNSPSSTRPSMRNFRQLLREAYSLRRKTAVRAKIRRPRLMIVSRKHTRVITNEHQVSRLATKMGYEVVVEEAGVSTNLSRFAETVNSCDVLMGVHGAGLTNMVFLPENAVLIQVIPFGRIDGFARLDFGNPTAGMNLRYLDYKIGVKDSSLRHEYASHHPVLRNPESYKKWDEIQSIYLNKQNVTVELHRFKGVLAKALKLLRH